MDSADEGSFDVVLLGTGLTESIAAAALAKAGFKVAHLDRVSYYGGSQASLTLDELVDWANEQCHVVQIRDNVSPIPYSRQYSVSLLPCLIPSIGPLIASLVSSGVARYGGFKLLERVAVCGSDHVLKNVPGGKEDIFNDSSIRLLDKRRLMKFLTFCISDGPLTDRPEVQGNEEQPFSDFLKQSFSLNDETANAVAYALGFCSSPSDPTSPALQRIQHYLRSAGRYGASPFLVGHYGSLGEIAQGFCRTAAVCGAVYILGREITSLSLTPQDSAEGGSKKRKYSIKISDFPDTLGADLIISSDLSVISRFLSEMDTPTYPISQATTVARCIAIVEESITLPSQEGEETSAVDTAVFVYPPLSVPSGHPSASATVLVTGEGSMSAPAGKSIVYISLPLPDEPTGQSAQDILTPYLSTFLSTTTTSNTTHEPLVLTIFYFDISHSTFPTTTTVGAENTILVPSPLETYPLPTPADAAAKNAEKLFWNAVEVLRARGGEEMEEITEMWPAMESTDEED